jgi:histone-lysine N-methyltransferase SETMAR
MSRSSTKTMLIVFFDIRGIVHREFVPQGQTVNKKFYCEVLQRLRENIRRKRLDLWRMKNWILHDDNAPCHRALLVRDLANHNMLSLPHPPYSPDLAPADFFLFPKIKMQLKGRRFHSIADIQRESQKVMDSHKMTSRPHSSSGRNTVTGALLCKVTISKEMVFKLR